MSRVVVRSLVVLFALVLFAAVSSVYADQIGGRFHEQDNFVKVEPAVLFHASVHHFQVPELTSNTIYGDNQDNWRNRGIRDGHWLRFSLRDGWKDYNGGGGGCDNNTPTPVATPEPGTLLLLGAGLFIVRRRVLNA